MAFYRCQCGYETDISNWNSIFDGETHCRQCGFSATESDTKISSDLATMLAGINIETIESQPYDMSMPRTPQVVPHEAPIAYITQHYTHSAHIALQQHDEIPLFDALAAVGVDASALQPSQIQLFRHAQPEQQARLVELWRIAPPTTGVQISAKHITNWPSTTHDREEEAATARRERAEQHERFKTLYASQGIAEPYIVNGYQNLASSPSRQTEGDRAEDIVRHDDKREREWWQVSGPMEHQYGMLQQIQMQDLQLDRQDEEML